VLLLILLPLLPVVLLLLVPVLLLQPVQGLVLGVVLLKLPRCMPVHTVLGFGFVLLTTHAHLPAAAVLPPAAAPRSAVPAVPYALPA
jgi:membrane protein required for beta-lactamase induction